MQEPYHAWVRTVTSAKTAEEVSILYHPSACLLPTFSNILCNNPEAIKQYFAGIVCKKALQISTQLLEHVQLDPSTLMSFGTYTFHYQENGKATAHPARFTFIFIQNENHWLIQHHHSSTIPST